VACGGSRKTWARETDALVAVPSKRTTSWAVALSPEPGPKVSRRPGEYFCDNSSNASTRAPGVRPGIRGATEASLPVADVACGEKGARKGFS